MIVNLLQRLFSSDCRKNLKEERQLRELSHVATVEKENAAISTYEQDIIALEKNYGPLHPGPLQLDLHTALAIMPRSRKKADAYKGLVSYLKKAYGVELSVTSKKVMRNEEKKL